VFAVVAPPCPDAEERSGAPPAGRPDSAAPEWLAKASTVWDPALRQRAEPRLARWKEDWAAPAQRAERFPTARAGEARKGSDQAAAHLGRAAPGWCRFAMADAAARWARWPAGAVPEPVCCAKVLRVSLQRNRCRTQAQRVPQDAQERFSRPAPAVPARARERELRVARQYAPARRRR
jgi:hypothetical protein